MLGVQAEIASLERADARTQMRRLVERDRIVLDRHDRADDEDREQDGHRDRVRDAGEREHGDRIRKSPAGGGTSCGF